MSTTFFVSPIGPKEWAEGKWEDWEEIEVDLEIQPEYLASQIKSKWPTAEVRIQLDDPNSIVYWHLPTCSSGNLQGNRNTIAFKYSEPFEEFVLWYRSIISEEHKLFLCDDSSSSELQLTSQTTYEDIIEWYASASNI